MPDDARWPRVDAETAVIPPSAGGLLCLPDLAGARAPRWHASARGVLCGLDLRHERGHLVRALFESVAMDVAEVLDTLRSQGATVDRVRVVGGGAASDVWNAIRADVTGMPFERPRDTEGTVTGTGFLALRAVGLLPRDVGAGTLARIEQSWTPDAERHATYRSVRDARDALYRSVEPVFRTLVSLRTSACPRG
jgi:sugar (pentulose or hexulose) kinase